MPEYKYLDKTGLTTFKSKIDVTYAKKNDVYTKTEVDEAIADASIPIVVVTASQVISQDDPIQIQLTNEQYALINRHPFIIDPSALGMDVTIMSYLGWYTKGGITYLVFGFGESEGTSIHFRKGVVNTSTKVAELSFNDELEVSYADQAGEATYADIAGKVDYDTTAPSSANTEGGLKIVVLSSEPATRYDGYLYIITEE